jgi:hypothetical protein
MQGPRNTNAGPVAGILLVVALLFVVAACGAVGASQPSPSAPVPSPTDPADEAPSVPAETPAATPGSDAIDLDVADPHQVSVVISDPDGLVSGAGSGRAGDGMSVRWGDVQVENVDDDTLRVTWVGLPVDAEIRLAVGREGDAVSLAFTQPAPPANSDATGFDRVLVLDFATPVRGEDVTASFATAG